ncbi:FCD domain-containing protein [Amycolatopsis acidiphila]|uniref:FadR family transcriptional regulator n=1 Tax=Amycolatopsis acidiphila TaxID=715473 RepID=A0A558A4L1_9PSEU|nr:FCD domain-containing protein [Amycolatopsis acidiphila]TVT19190.1 FadR family transcriptional regulator [Amycolatopsis acidiphila]UIJ62006.1 FCD domain-containing protein [Amycolatopsis acidiphila]GHG56678.1 GntR family transcriptional regulator [Amycolatopsis acidiphila]
MSKLEDSLRTLLAEGARAGTLGPGAKLPPERDLVQQLEAPRSAVRRALDILERDGLVVRYVGRGTFVTEVVTQHVDGAPSDTSPAEIMQVRQLLEPQVATLAARVATQADLDRIAGCLDGGGQSPDFEGFERWDAKLHRAIAAAAHNGLLMNMFDVMNTARALPVWGSLKRRTSTPELRRCYHQEHMEIVAALQDRDPLGAGENMRVHLQHVADSLLGRG